MASQLSLFSSLPTARSPKSRDQLFAEKCVALSLASRPPVSPLEPPPVVRVCPERGYTIVTRGNRSVYYPHRDR